MDIATIIGLLAGLGLIAGTIVMGGNVGGFVDVPSLIVVVGGTMAATMVMFPLGLVLGSISVALKAFLFKMPSAAAAVREIVKLADVARKEGLVALEKVQVGDPFLQKGVIMVANGSEKAQVRGCLDAEVEAMLLRHERGQNVFKGMGMLSPAFGMIGTLIGLVQMLQTLDDPASIGPSMAVALLTTFYGAVMANLIFLPIAKKLEDRSREEQFYKEMITAGVMSLINGEHPMDIQDKLSSYLSPRVRAKEGLAGGGK